MNSRILVHRCPHCKRIHDVDFDYIWSVKLKQPYLEEQNEQTI